MTWKRPSGPVHIWKKINIHDTNNVERKFTIQEISSDQYEEVVNHMSNIYTRYEPMTSCYNLAEDEKSLKDFQDIWNVMLQQGISIAAYETIDESKTSILAGVNILYKSDNEFEKYMKKFQVINNKISIFQGESSKILFDFQNKCYEKLDPHELYGVDEYLGAFGLSVDLNYRQLGLGKILLETRDDICREYNIKYTSTFFTSSFAQKAATHAGFTVKLDQKFDNAIDKNGKKLFPKLSGKNCKLMDKKID
ncbi:hypothetical protein HCN44_003796 [Aphidius gifuensis]|uniref:N-acetyltransferase domain-containing protein n=1 Tax=Aphidius gifuensis TaxID=684658 RepID=A0A835CNA3_APHGI|nr:hypothetical protein HCN44_003796 [Aphidius gifuensis]